MRSFIVLFLLFEAAINADADECEDAGIPCDLNGECISEGGSHICICNEGFVGDGEVCTDEDECLSGTNTCDQNAQCTNTVGSYYCVCNAGFAGDGTICTDEDECLSGTNTCDQNAQCTNTVGSYYCVCNAGFAGDGTICTDEDECLSGTNTCDQNAQCTNTVGSYYCVCNAGFAGDGTICTDEDECLSGTNTCDQNAQCTNTVGSYYCVCNAGFAGDGTICTDENECMSGTFCDPNADCMNTEGSFTCDCHAGFAGFGFSCTDFQELENVALNKNATQSSDEPNTWDVHHWQPNNAVDGDSGSSWSTCSSTNGWQNHQNAWWQVDLENAYRIEAVTIQNRGECCGERLKDVSIKIGMQADQMSEVAVFDGPGATGAYYEVSVPPTIGRFVKLEINDPVNAIVTLCEVQVMGTDVPTACWDGVKSREYIGNISTTGDGLTCQAFSAQNPHAHNRNNPSMFPYDDSVADAQNQCRDPDLAGAPWCYTTDPGVRWQFCQIPLCSQESACICTVQGDPHILTYDGQKINYQGICLYKFADLVKDDCSVVVYFKTTRRSVHSKATYVEEIHVIIGITGDLIIIRQNKEVTVNNVTKTPTYPGEGFVISDDSGFIVVTTACGLTAMYDGKKIAKVIINKEDGYNTHGMCGNCNGVPSDLKKADGIDVSNEKDKFKKIGNSYAIPPLDECKCVTMEQNISFNSAKYCNHKSAKIHGISNFKKKCRMGNPKASRHQVCQEVSITFCTNENQSIFILYNNNKKTYRQ